MTEKNVYWDAKQKKQNKTKNMLARIGQDTLVNVYVALPVFTPVAGRSYAHFMEQNGGAHDVNRLFGRYFHFCWC